MVPIQSGDNQDFIDAINNEGLTVTRSFKLLGFDLTNDNSNLHKNVDNLKEKINKILQYSIVWTIMRACLCHIKAIILDFHIIAFLFLV